MKKRRIPLLVYIVTLLVALLLQWSGTLQGLENRFSDHLYQSASRINPNIYVIGIDEQTLSDYGSFDTWGREKTAQLISLLTENPDNAPAVIAIDVGFYGNKDAATDKALVEAVQRAGNVVLVSSATFGDTIRESENGQFATSREILVLEEPFEDLKNAAAAVGHSNIELDSDGVARHAQGTLRYENESILSFAQAICSVYGSNSSLISRQGASYISYTGMPRDYYGSVGAGCSFERVLEGDYPVSAFRGAIVLIGAYASGMQDNYYTSIDYSTQMYGVEIHANITDQILSSIQKTELTYSTALLISVIFGVVCLLLYLILPTKISLPVVLILSAGYVFLTKMLYQSSDLVSPVLYVPFIGILLSIVHILVRYFVVHLEKKRIIANYGKYLSPEIAATIAKTGEDSLKLGGQKKDIAVLFVDIRGFTSLSESLSPERIVTMLNEYLSVTTSAIFHQKGTVDKFIGDATMGVFNAPLDLDDYTYRAVCAGLEMAKNAAVMAEKLDKDLQNRVGFGIGIHCGEAVVGNIGTDFRMEYTAIGDTVNTASRLEGQAKAGEVIISETVYERVKGRIRCEDKGTCRLKGKAEEVKIYRAIEIIS